ncbi:MAG: hypothetical protein ACO1SV_04575 [Fimbriimonas sp.]
MDLPILLQVEGNEDDRVLTARIHRQHAPPSRLIQVGSSTEGRSVLESGVRPALVLVASRLEPEDGISFVRWYRDRFGSEGRLFLLTGNLDATATRHALAAGADGVVFRTADLGRMATALASVFETYLVP